MSEQNKQLTAELPKAMENENKTFFGVKMDFDSLDEKMKRFVMLRNELAMLAEEIGMEVRKGLMVLTMEEK